MKAIRYLQPLLLIGLLAQTACTSAPLAKMSPALLHQATPDDIRQLSKVVASALKIKIDMVSLAPDVFTQSSQLVIERNAQSPAATPELNGRLISEPVIHRFMLMRSSDDCYLVYQKTGESQRLQGLSCK